MPTTATELAKARDTLAGLLALLDLGGYRFELSPEGDDWTFALECAACPTSSTLAYCHSSGKASA